MEAQDISGSFKSRSFIVKFSSIQLLWKSIKGKLNCYKIYFKWTTGMKVVLII